MEAPQGGSCSSLASSASDETAPKNNRNCIPSNLNNVSNTFVPNALPIASQKTLRMNSIGSGQNNLLHSYSTNDATLGEYKYTVTVGSHNIKITGDQIDLVRVRY